MTPILKKPKLDPEDLNNYRLISNLPYLSKLIEYVIAAQLVRHLERHLISEPSRELTGSFIPQRLPSHMSPTTSYVLWTGRSQCSLFSLTFPLHLTLSMTNSYYQDWKTRSDSVDRSGLGDFPPDRKISVCFSLQLQF